MSRSSVTSDGKNIVSMWPTEGDRKNFVTHNWADKTSWYPQAVRVVEATCSATTPGSVYQTPDTFLIDTFHGKIWDEDSLLDANGNSYRVAVEVDEGGGWQAKTEVDPHTLAGDYTVDYEAGEITFSPAIDTGASVRATYHKAQGSSYFIYPLTGKKLQIKSAEVQFSQDVEMLDTVDFIAHGYAAVFAPHLIQANGGPLPNDATIPLRTTRYKTMYDFQAESNRALPTIPAIGGNGWRGIKNPIIVFPWTYDALLSVSSAAGMFIEIKLQHDAPMGGEFCTATFYCLSEDE